MPGSFERFERGERVVFRTHQDRTAAKGYACVKGGDGDTVGHHTRTTRSVVFPDDVCLLHDAQHADAAPVSSPFRHLEV